MKIFLLVCSELGVPISAEKTVWAMRLLTLLGVLLDGEFFRLSIPEEKHLKAINLLQNVVTSHKVTVKQVQQLAGVLNFLCRVIFTGRAFTRRMYAKYSGLVENTQLKPYHHVKVDLEFKFDCRVWLNFLDREMVSTVSRPYLDLTDDSNVVQLEFYSDASLCDDLGFGAGYDREWTYGQWPVGFVKKYSPSIEIVELFGLAVAVEIWQRKLMNKRVCVYCDNESVVYMINNSASSCPIYMKLIRGLVLKGLKFNFRIFAKHLKSEENEVADSLSHLQCH